MKFKIFIILAVVISTIFTSCTEDDDTPIGNWVLKAYFEGRQRAEGTSFEIGDKGYFGMGRDDDGYLSDFWQFDPDKNAWTQVADFPGTLRSYNVSISNGSKGYVGLGYDGNNDLADFWEYDANSDSWTQVADFGGGERRYATAFAIGNDIYVGTGTQEEDKLFTNDFWKFDGTSWSKITTLSGEKRRKANAVSLDGKGYVIGGQHNGAIADFWEYDPASDTWTQLTKTNDEDTGATGIPRFNAIAFAVNGNLYLAGGNTGNVAVSTVYEWNPTDAAWTEKTSIEALYSREGAGSFVLNGKAYIVGGRSGSSFLDDCYMFEPDQEKDSDD